ncbi:MAG: glycoside hydrolase family 16 protein [Bacteroidales bacterium]
MKNNVYSLVIITILLFQACNSQTGKNDNNSDTLTNHYQLVWSDEFNYTGLPDSTKWSYDIDGNEWNWGNNEYQNYTRARKENAFVDGQYLHIVALQEKWEKKDYTSARLITKGKGDWLYGKFEIRAKVPGGKGIWPAIWMLPTDWQYGDWPKSGEIDIMEHVGYMPDSIFGSVHTETYNHVIGTQKTKGFYLPDCEKEFHNYVLEWDSTDCRIFIDTIQYFQFKNEGNGYKVWPFDKRFHLLLNVAVGGNWGAAGGFDKSIFPCEMQVDYVRVYKKE